MHPAVRAAVQRIADEANQLVSRAEGIREFRIMNRDPTEEDGYLTPAQDSPCEGAAVISPPTWDEMYGRVTATTSDSLVPTAGLRRRADGATREVRPGDRASGRVRRISRPSVRPSSVTKQPSAWASCGTGRRDDPGNTREPCGSRRDSQETGGIRESTKREGAPTRLRSTAEELARRMLQGRSSARRKEARVA